VNPLRLEAGRNPTEKGNEEVEVRQSNAPRYIELPRQFDIALVLETFGYRMPTPWRLISAAPGREKWRENAFCDHDAN